MKQNWIKVTDDAMVVEKMLNHEVQVLRENMKILRLQPQRIW